MSPEALQEKLRRILKTSTLEVKRDAAWAVKNHRHPAAMQVWDRGVVTGEPYIVAVCERNGLPAEPDEKFFLRLWQMHANQVHRGRLGWADKIAFDARDHQDHQEQQASKKFRERINSHRGEIFSLLGKNKFWNLNRSLVPQ